MIDRVISIPAYESLSPHGASRVPPPPTTHDIGGSVNVQIPGHPPGTIPRDKLAAFKKKYPNARVF
jgi:hypothetical protein